MIIHLLYIFSFPLEKIHNSKKVKKKKKTLYNIIKNKIVKK